MYGRLAKWIFSVKAMPYWCVLVADCIIVCIAALVSTSLVRGSLGSVPEVMRTLLVYLVFYIIGFRVMRTYRGVLRYSSFVDLYRIGAAMLIGTLLITCMRVFFRIDDWLAPIRVREQVGIFILATAMMGGLRVFVKYLYDRMCASRSAKRVFIYGVKRGGIGLAKSMANDQPRRFTLCGFVSDETDMVGKILMGVKVYRKSHDLIYRMKQMEIEGLMVSPLKQAGLVEDTQFVDALIDAGIAIYTTDAAEKWDGKSDLSARRFHEVEIEDLLPRDEIHVDLEAVGGMLRGTVVMVTGAAGSIGSEIVRQVAQFAPRLIVAVDAAETPMHDLRLAMRRDYPGVECSTVVTNICRQNRMESIFAATHPDYVFHAAAYKHVPMMEDNPSEAVENNVLGTCIVADLALKYGVRKFVMISTDKAVNPTNVMGCSKRICEIYVQSLNNALRAGSVKGTTQFVTTRFGNVLGSNGSVIPLFREQIKRGGPVTVTHPDIIRFFMLIPEACRLVLEAGTMGKGGEIFVFDMGKPVKIADLARRMIRLSGMTGVEVKFTGLRQGEKLYEEVLSEAETTLPTFNPKIKIAKVREYDYAEVQKMIERLVATSRKYDDILTVEQMKLIVPEYKSRNSVYEKLDTPACNG